MRTSSKLNSSVKKNRSIFTNASRNASILPETSNRQIGFCSLSTISWMRSLPSGSGRSSRSSENVSSMPPATPAETMTRSTDAAGEHLAEERDLGDVVALGVEVVDEDAVEQGDAAMPPSSSLRMPLVS